VTHAELVPLLETGALLAVRVTGWTEPGYVHRDHVPVLQKALAGQLRATHTTLLSPFDPLVWDRARARTLFDFEYAIECYTPAPKRRYGYYVLPILHRGELIGRLDAKAHREERVFAISALFLEPGRPVSARLVEELAASIGRTARWHGTPTVVVERSEPASLARALRAHLTG
jgi:uncharacterized protein YcaQ